MVSTFRTNRLVCASVVLALVAAPNALRAGVCQVECQPGDIDEGEPNCGQPFDSVNAGCVDPPLFTPIVCGQAVCGTTQFNNQTFAFDNDSYVFVVGEPTLVTFVLTSEFPAEMVLFLGGCPEADALEFIGPADPCGQSSFSRCLPPGDYQLHVIPFTQSPNSADCGARYRLEMFCTPCELAPNLTCATAPLLDIPSTTFDDTIDGFVNAGLPVCGFPATSPGVWYRVLGTGRTITASTCGGGTDFETALSVFCGSCDEPFCAASNNISECDDPTRAEVSWCSEAGTEYYILVYAGFFFPPSGNFQLDLSEDGVACDTATPCFACPDTCPPDATKEDEPNCGLSEVGQPDYTVNGGCNTAQPTFSEIEFDVPFCGTAAFNGVFRDEDWIEIATDGSNVISIDVWADFEAEVAIYAAAPRCPIYQTVTSGIGPRCQPFTVTTECIPQNTYYLVVAPRFADVVPCGRGYTITVHAEPCEICPGVEFPAECPEVTTECVPVSCGSTGCSSAVHPGGFDVDCYELTLDEPSRVRFRTTTQFHYELQILEVLPDQSFATRAVAVGAPCDPVEAVACLDVGTYFLLLVTEPGQIPFPFGLAYEYEIICDTCEPTSGCTVNATPEGEPDCGFPVDFTNGGCYWPPPRFIDIECGEEICGTVGTLDFDRDSDWYQLTVTAPTTVTWSMNAQFPAQIAIVDNDGDPSNCVGILKPMTSTSSVTPVEISKRLTPGTWWFFVRSAVFPVSCGAEYSVVLSCDCGCPGDVSGDGLKNGDDIQQFVDCLLGADPAGCLCADLDGSNGVTTDDTALFVSELTVGATCGG